MTAVTNSKLVVDTANGYKLKATSNIAAGW